MSFTGNYSCNTLRSGLMNGSIDFSTDTFFLALYTNAATLDQLKVYLAERQIQPGVGEWLADRDWMQSRVKQEVITLKFGVARGDRIELSRDPAIQQALNRLKR